MVNSVVVTVDLTSDVSVVGDFHVFTGSNTRLSGRKDEFKFFSDDAEIGEKLHIGDRIVITGHLASTTAKDNIYIRENRIFVDSWYRETSDTYKNDVKLDGVKCMKVISYRKPKTLEDGMILTVVVKTGSGTAARVTFWNNSAIRLHDACEAGKNLDIQGRLESYVDKRSDKLVWTVVSSFARVSAEKKSNEKSDDTAEN